MPAGDASVIVRGVTSSRAFICLACGCDLADRVRATGSLRCDACRELNAPLRLEHARWERALRLSRSRLDPFEEPTAA
jgi:hypothetical protein